MKERRRFLSAVLSLLLSFSLGTPAVMAEEEAEEHPEEILEPAAAEEPPAESEEHPEELNAPDESPEESTVPEGTEEVPDAEPSEDKEEILPEEPKEETESEPLSEEEAKEEERFVIPEGFAVNARDLRSKEAMKENDAAATLETLEEGRDYERFRLLILTSDREYAETAASIYRGELVSYSYGVGIIQLSEDGPSVKECVLACLEDENLPYVEPNYISVIEPERDPERESEAEGYVLPKEKTWSDWISGALEHPDPYLLNPTGEYYSWHLAEIGAYSGWNATMGNSEIKVAVIDTYINPSHQELEGKVTNYDIGKGDYYGTGGHGTQMAGVIAAAVNNEAGGAGIAPNVKLLGINIFYYNAETDSDTYDSVDFIRAVNLAVEEGATIINMSLGAAVYSRFEEEAIAYAADKGVTVVVSAGNDGSNIKKYPAAYENVITVGATGKNGSRVYFSNYGPWVTVSAPGVDIPAPLTSTKYPYNNTYTTSSGTSPAAAVVSGALALYMSRFGKISPKESLALVKRCVNKCESEGMGSGIISVEKMFEKDDKTPVIHVYNKYGNPVVNFNIPLEAGCYLVIESPNPEDNETILFTSDGKAPLIRDGEVVHGYVYEPGTKIPLDEYEMSTTKKFTAVVVNSFSSAGKAVSLSVKTPLPPSAPVKIKTLKLDHTAATLRVSDPQEIHESVLIGPSSLINEKGEPVNLDEVYHEWVTSDSSVVRVDSKGVVTAVSSGTATVKLKILDGSNKTATCKITVVQLAESAVIEGQNSMIPGSSFKYKVTVSPSNTKSKKVEWSLKEPVEGVSIDKNGKVKVDAGAAAGTSFTISAACLDESGVVAEKTVAVAPKATAIALASDDPRVTRNAKNVITGAYAFTCDLKDDLHPAADNEILFAAEITGNDIAPKWTSSNTRVATVDQNGKVTAHAAGTAKITAETMDGSKKKASVTLTVRVPISSLAIDTELDYIVVPGKSIDFSKKVAYGNTYGKPTMKSADWKITKVTQGEADITEDVLAKKLIQIKNGKVTVSNKIEKDYPLSDGNMTVNLQAESKDGTGFTAAAYFYVCRPATISWLDKPGEKTATAAMDRVYSIPLFTDSLTNFSVTSSNPNLGGVMINNSKYEKYSYEQGGRTIEGYKFTVTLITNDKKGTFTITAKHLNGSGKTEKLKIQLLPKQ